MGIDRAGNKDPRPEELYSLQNWAINMTSKLKMVMRFGFTALKVSDAIKKYIEPALSSLRDE